MVAGAVVRAGHLAVAGVKVAAVAEGKAVGCVGAEELGGARLHQGYVGILVGVHQPTVDGLQVADNGVVGGCSCWLKAPS